MHLLLLLLQLLVVVVALCACSLNGLHNFFVLLFNLTSVTHTLHCYNRLVAALVIVTVVVVVVDALLDIDTVTLVQFTQKKSSNNKH